MLDPAVRPSARAARRSGVGESGAGLAASPFRVDRDRIAASPYFARLAGVTQVVSPTGGGLLLHNRLTHSLQVAQVARAIAERLVRDLAGADLPDQVVLDLTRVHTVNAVARRMVLETMRRLTADGHQVVLVDPDEHLPDSSTSASVHPQVQTPSPVR